MERWKNTRKGYHRYSDRTKSATSSLLILVQTYEVEQLQYLLLQFYFTLLVFLLLRFRSHNFLFLVVHGFNTVITKTYTYLIALRIGLSAALTLFCMFPDKKRSHYCYFPDKDYKTLQ